MIKCKYCKEKIDPPTSSYRTCNECYKEIKGEEEHETRIEDLIGQENGNYTIIEAIRVKFTKGFAPGGFVIGRECAGNYVVWRYNEQTGGFSAGRYKSQSEDQNEINSLQETLDNLRKRVSRARKARERIKKEREERKNSEGDKLL